MTRTVPPDGRNGGARERFGSLPPAEQAALLARLRERRSGAAGAGQQDPWFVRDTRDAPPRMRLFCFAYAGGGASVYRLWGRDLPPEIEVVAVQPPGRETRLEEQAFRSLAPLVDDLAGHIVPLLDRPFAFYGHSMGALVAFELARVLRSCGEPGPEHLLLGAYRAPHLPSPHIRIHHLPDEVLKIVMENDGTSPDVLRNDELMAMVLPTLRADLELCDVEPHEPDPLDCPMTVFGGSDDVRVRPPDLDAWREHTTGRFHHETLPGSHFFVHGTHRQLLAAVRERLLPHLLSTKKAGEHD